MFPTHPSQRTAANIAWWALVLAIVLASLLPRPANTLGEIQDAYDDVLHAGCYALLAGSRAIFEPKRRIPAVFAFCFLLGLAIEFVQPMTGRAFDVADILANTAGLTIGVIAGLAFHSCLTQPATNR
ncbi:MAG: VanZ family protein [Bryobacteraceae bacterium]